MAYKSGNPALSKKTFSNLPVGHGVMTLNGVAAKSLLLLIICVASGVVGWRMMAQSSDTVFILLIVASILALIIAIITVIKKKFSPIGAPLYVLTEGFVLGAISQLFEAEFSGIVLQALLLTGSIFVAMLLLYLSRVIKVTENFKLGVAAATLGIFLYYLVNLGVNLLFHSQLPLISSNSWWGIGFSVLVIIVAALNLTVDFDFIEQGVEQKAPKYMEWYSSFGLFVTVVWLYIEALRLLAKIRSR